MHACIISAACESRYYRSLNGDVWFHTVYVCMYAFIQLHTCYIFLYVCMNVYMYPCIHFFNCILSICYCMSVCMYARKLWERFQPLLRPPLPPPSAPPISTPSIQIEGVPRRVFSLCERIQVQHENKDHYRSNGKRRLSEFSHYTNIW